MNKTNILAALAAIVLLSAGCTNVRPIGKVNGLDATRITTRGVFSPSTTTVVLSDPNQPGTIAGVIANAQGPGFVPAVATAGGVAGGAALLRPARSNTTVSQEGGNASATGGNASAIGGSGSTTQNGSVHHNTGNGNGSGNNGNH